MIPETLQIKPGVDLAGISGKMWEAVPHIAKAFAAEGCACVITSGRDGTHMPTSKHYTGEALDFRARDVPEGKRETILNWIRKSLGADYDALLHGSVVHYHVEYDPK